MILDETIEMEANLYDKNYIEVSNILEEEDAQSDRAESETADPGDMKFDEGSNTQQNKDIVTENKIQTVVADFVVLPSFTIGY